MSTANEAVACTASGLAPRAGLTSTTSMTDSKPVGGVSAGQTQAFLKTSVPESSSAPVLWTSSVM